MPSLNPYLNFNGNTEDAFNFYKSVFGGEFAQLQRFKDVPSEQPMPDIDAQKIMHVALPIGKDNVLMGSDTPKGYQSIVGTNFSISVNAATEQETEKLFKGLSAGGKVTMPLEKTFWGAYFGMLTDKFGINWMVSTEQRNN
ncbi:MAG TPA: VOC family protein [Bacteroidia bacterium]|jgi:PhnB protein|nr:VOC family protein [Bacteroidia bacterium]